MFSHRHSGCGSIGELPGTIHTGRYLWGQYELRHAFWLPDEPAAPVGRRLQGQRLYKSGGTTDAHYVGRFFGDSAPVIRLVTRVSATGGP